jgi:2-hydroxy-6-oxo-6-(2'-carboxyphenyl)-hexa-2,4-dienoate hydrolase
VADCRISTYGREDRGLLPKPKESGVPLGEEKFVDVNGIRTRYFDNGQGETILLLHGSFFGEPFSSDCAANWSENFQGLSEFARVIAMDRLGQGYTDNPKRIEDYTMKAVGEHVRDFIKVLRLGRVHIVGHSRGGYVACRATLDYPDVIKTCVIVDSGTLAPGTTPMHEIMADAPKPNLTEESQRWVLRRYSFGDEHITDEWVGELAAVAATPKYREAAAIVEKSSYAADLQREKVETFELIKSRGMRKPTLVVWSLNDPTATIERGRCSRPSPKRSGRRRCMSSTSPGTSCTANTRRSSMRCSRAGYHDMPADRPMQTRPISGGSHALA